LEGLTSPLEYSLAKRLMRPITWQPHDTDDSIICFSGGNIPLVPARSCHPRPFIPRISDE